MRTLITACLFLAATSTAVSAGQWPVVVTSEGGQSIEGRLLSLTPERVTVSHRGRLEQIPLDTVVRIVRPRDGVADGLVKGFLLGFLPVLIFSGDAGVASKVGVTYGLVGAGVDALHGETFVLYDRSATPRAPARPAVGWTIRF